MDEQLEIVLREMCGRVGANYDEVDFDKDGWWLERSWPSDQEEDFKSWLEDHLKKSSAARNALMSTPLDYARSRRRFADMFLLSYGWKSE